MDERTALTAALIECGRVLHQSGIVRARAGNLSARLSDGRVLITRAHTHKGLLEPADLLLLDAHGVPLEAGAASSETTLHMAAYAADPAVLAVGHAHPLACTTLAHQGRLLAVELAEEGPTVLGAPPLLEDTPRAARDAAWGAVVAAGTRAALLRSHGLVVAGTSPRDVIARMELAEWLAELQGRLHQSQIF